MIERALELDPPLQHRAHLRIVRAWLLVWQGRLEEADALLAEFRSLIGPVQPAPQYAVGAIRTDAEYALAARRPGPGLGRPAALPEPSRHATTRRWSFRCWRSPPRPPAGWTIATAAVSTPRRSRRRLRVGPAGP